MISSLDDGFCLFLSVVFLEKVLTDSFRPFSSTHDGFEGAGYFELMIYSTDVETAIKGDPRVLFFWPRLFGGAQRRTTNLPRVFLAPDRVLLMGVLTPSFR